MPARILIVYGTTYGQTAKIARYISDVLRSGGFEVRLLNADVVPADFTLSNHDAVIVGASVHFHHHQHSVERFVRAHRDTLNAMPSAFFSVSGAAAGAEEPDREDASGLLNAFLNRVGWQPAETAIFGGAIAYTRYKPWTRLMMRALSHRYGGPTDTSHDYEATDWLQVRRFADEVTARVERPAAVAPGRELGGSRPAVGRAVRIGSQQPDAQRETHILRP
ncbi:MAG TPA: flavodoxin domain-containing protein [Gemmatimonadaceae bacterium]|nr:flavodoxin domain-containing protein [Gemmatimonadaceae bacterium]